MKNLNFKGIAHVFAALLAVGLGAACQPVEEEEADVMDLEMDEVDLESEGGLYDRFDRVDLSDWHRNRGRLGEDLLFRSVVLGREVVPVSPLAPFDMAYGRSWVGLKARKGLDGRVIGVDPRIRTTLCGLGSSRFIDVSRVSIGHGPRGVVGDARLLDAVWGPRATYRARVIDGCANLYLRAQFCDGCDALDVFDKIHHFPSDYNIIVSTTDFPDGLYRGQLCLDLDACPDWNQDWEDPRIRRW